MPADARMPARLADGTAGLRRRRFQRCGTTRWWRLLTAHPQIHRPQHKELHFFDRLQGSEPATAITDAYRREFPRPPGLLGE